MTFDVAHDTRGGQRGPCKTGAFAMRDPQSSRQHCTVLTRHGLLMTLTCVLLLAMFALVSRPAAAFAFPGCMTAIWLSWTVPMARSGD